jgi:hypothetical protein
MNTKQNFRSTKNGHSWAYKRKEIAFPKDDLTVAKRTQRHMSNHPNDKNERKTKGVTWSKRTQKDKDLDEFHKNHIWTYTDRTMVKKWIFIGSEEE